MYYLKEGTKLVVVTSTAKDETLKVGQELVVTELMGNGKYKAKGSAADYAWYIEVCDSAIRVCGLSVTLEVAKAKPDFKRVALMQSLKCKYDVIEQWSDGNYQAEGSEYRVLTDSEADDALEEALESLLDDVVLPEVDDTLAKYFDREAWKRDAAYDGRGHYLNHYDGTEEEQTVDGETYFIYQID